VRRAVAIAAAVLIGLLGLAGAAVWVLTRAEFADAVRGRLVREASLALRRDVVVTRKPHRVIQTLEQLREEQVGVAIGTSYVETVRAAGVPSKNLKIIGSASSLAELMRSGAITATVEGVEIALAPQEEDPSVQLGMFLGPPQSIALGVRKEDQQLLAALNDYIGNVRKTPTWNRLVIKYFGDRAIDVLRRARGE